MIYKNMCCYSHIELAVNVQLSSLNGRPVNLQSEQYTVNSAYVLQTLKAR